MVTLVHSCFARFGGVAMGRIELVQQYLSFLCLFELFLIPCFWSRCCHWLLCCGECWCSSCDDCGWLQCVTYILKSDEKALGCNSVCRMPLSQADVVTVFHRTPHFCVTLQQVWFFCSPEFFVSLITLKAFSFDLALLIVVVSFRPLIFASVPSRWHSKRRL